MAHRIDLTKVVNRMQANSDRAANNIVVAEELLAKDSDNRRRGRSLTQPVDIAENLTEADALLTELHMDLESVKKLQHPQSQEIEQDVGDLTDRWSKTCSEYQDLYKQSLGLDLSPNTDWPGLLSTKLRKIQTGGYGLSLTDVEKQLAAHEVLHKEIESYRSHLDSPLKSQYNRLVEESVRRKANLSSLYDYLLRCNKEINFFIEQQTRIRKTDWSDLMRESGVRSEYERFKSNSLPTHESEVGKLQEEADTLINTNHPGYDSISKHNDKVKREWNHFLNLCHCQETHLNNVELYKKYQLDTEMISESLKRVNSTMEPSLLSNMSNSQILTQLEAEERAVQRNERRLADLKEFCDRIAPLPQRRAQYYRGPVTALCEWSEDTGSVHRGEKYTLQSSPRDESWEVKDSLGEKKVIPGVCFVIPPPDSEAIERVEGLEHDFASLKRRRSSLQASIRSPTEEVVKVTRKVSMSSTPDSASLPVLSRASRDDDRLDQLIADLMKLEKEVLGRLRTPLARSDHTGDLAVRIREHERAVSTLRNLESEKASIQREINHQLSSSPFLAQKLSTATNKIEDLNTITELYGQKANAVMPLEEQIKRVDLTLNGLEDRLGRDTIIYNKPNAIEDHIKLLENIQTDVKVKQVEIQKLNKDLNLTEELCGHLQKSFQEYCPDIYRQETEVKNLRNRYAKIVNHLEHRLTLMKEAEQKNNSFQSAVNSLSKFLNHLHNTNVYSSDTYTEITYKHYAQKWTIEELKKKSYDVDQILKLSTELQDILKEYEAITYQYHRSVSDTQSEIRSWQTLTLAEASQYMEKDVVNSYYEVLAENSQLYDQMLLSSNMVNKQETVVNRVVVYQQMELEEVENLKKDLADEISRRIHAENEMENYRTRIVALRSRRGVERVEEIETVQYYRDSKLEADLVAWKNEIDEQILRHSMVHSEIEIINRKVISLEHEAENIKPKLILKVMTEFGRDLKLEKEEIFIREEFRRLREEIQVRETEIVQKTSEFMYLENKKQTIIERVVKKEVVKIEKDPEMLKAVIAFREELSEISTRSKYLTSEIFQITSQMSSLERIIPTIQPKIITKEVLKVEQDQETLRESHILRRSLEEIQQEITVMLTEIKSLEVRYTHVEKVTQKIEFRETVNEVYRIDPDTEIELRRLRKEIQEWLSKRVEIEKTVKLVTVDITILHSEKPRVEVKEVFQEVIIEERSPEVTRELIRLKEHLSQIQATYHTTLEKLSILRRERDEWKVERSRIEMKVITTERIKYEINPLVEKEAEQLRKELQEELQLIRIMEEHVIDIRQKFITLEKQRYQEKIVYQEVIILQKDQKQIIEHESLSRRFTEELTSRRTVEEEVRKLRAIVQEKKILIQQSDVQQKKITIDAELIEIRSLVLTFENAPPPQEKIIIEEVVRVERDSDTDRQINSLRIEIERESSKTTALLRDIQNLKLRVETMTKEKSVEKTIYKEVIRYEKDHTLDLERNCLKDQISQVRIARRNHEEEIQHIQTKITRVQTTVTTYTREETTLTQTLTILKKERDELLRELKSLERERTEITIRFQQESKLMSERSQMFKQKLFKLESDLQILEKEIYAEKEKIQKKEITIIQLRDSIKKEDRSDSLTTETTKSTKITILDPETGKDMSPYDAYMQGLIDRSYYMHLQTLECSWEEITTSGPDGETAILMDLKSGKKYSIQEALLAGRLTQYDVQQYKEGKVPISVFALKVAGEKTRRATITEIIPPSSPVKSVSSSSLMRSFSSSSQSSLQRSLSLSSTNLSSTTLYSTGEDTFPISGILDTTTKSRMSVRSAMTRKLIDPDTAQKLLEVQAATGGIVDINKKERFSVHKAVERGLIDPTLLQKLIIAQKAFTGVEDPASKERLSVGQAAQKGLIPSENAKRYLEAQYLTGGLVDPNTPGRINLQSGVDANMITQQTLRELEDDHKHMKELVDPNTKSRITYKEAMALCKKDETTGLLLLPVTSTDSVDSVSYNSFSYSAKISY
ncbi:envoplakin-like [Trichomycterus rosablanca]|uniref:envoplakin-like n=1 Tax=Trichomycterus rosablanca TaxID=2290929 RepID=UPI002F35ED51